MGKKSFQKKGSLLQKEDFMKKLVLMMHNTQSPFTHPIIHWKFAVKFKCKRKESHTACGTNKYPTRPAVHKRAQNTKTRSVLSSLCFCERKCVWFRWCVIYTLFFFFCCAASLKQSSENIYGSLQSFRTRRKLFFLGPHFEIKKVTL